VGGRDLRIESLSSAYTTKWVPVSKTQEKNPKTKWIKRYPMFMDQKTVS
jgi:hypothetical protein